MQNRQLTPPYADTNSHTRPDSERKPRGPKANPCTKAHDESHTCITCRIALIVAVWQGVPTCKHLVTRKSSYMQSTCASSWTYKLPSTGL